MAFDLEMLRTASRSREQSRGAIAFLINFKWRFNLPALLTVTVSGSLAIGVRAEAIDQATKVRAPNLKKLRIIWSYSRTLSKERERERVSNAQIRSTFEEQNLKNTLGYLARAYKRFAYLTYSSRSFRDCPYRSNSKI